MKPEPAVTVTVWPTLKVPTTLLVRVIVNELPLVFPAVPDIVPCTLAKFVFGVVVVARGVGMATTLTVSAEVNVPTALPVKVMINELPLVVPDIEATVPCTWAKLLFT